ncbi:MAG: hypothetical protein QG671_333 [Actinomycetota bacterium]|nr:hypothetical protein [Actinomycetota bacterium]
MPKEQLTPELRALRSRIGGHAKWAKEPDRSAATAKARRAQLDRFDKQVDPDGVLTPQERAKRAESARKEYYTRLAFLSAQARRRKGGAA